MDDLEPDGGNDWTDGTLDADFDDAGWIPEWTPSRPDDGLYWDWIQ